MGEVIREMIYGCCSAFDLSAGAYPCPDYLSSTKTPVEEIAMDWEKLCTDGQNALITFEAK